ncbi:MAG: TldD/PmbA family protein [Maritimibacter sp.]
MSISLENLAHQLLDAAAKAGADAADAMAVAGTSLSIQTRNGALEDAERSEGCDIGLRVMVGQRQANVSSSDASPDTITAMAERAVAMAREAPEDSSICQAREGEYATTWDIAALELEDVSPEPAPEALQENALLCAEAASRVKGVNQVESTSASYGASENFLATSQGFSGGYRRTGRSLSLAAIAGTGAEMERDFNGEGRIFQADMPSAEEIGRIAGERAVARFGAKQPPTGTFPVLFDLRVASSLIGHLLAAVNGAAIVRGQSFLRDKLGAQVLPAQISLVEDPLRARVTGSRPFDGEGLACARRDIIQDGVLTGWTLDLGCAQRLGMKSTASAARGTSAPPSPSMSNIWLTPGDKSPAELMADMGTGLLVTSLIGSTVNPNTGDYSRGASGFWIENGVAAYPVNECTIAGNLNDMLARMIPSNDGETHKSTVVPSILIEGMTLAGA